MNWKKHGRTLICLLIICTLIFNISPIRAHAIVLEGYATVETIALIIAALAALGVAKGVADAAIDNLAHDIANSEEMAPYQTDGKSKVTRLYPSDDNGTGPLWYIPFVILEIIKAYLWDEENGILSSNRSIPENDITSSESFKSAFALADSKPYGVLIYDGSFAGVAYSDYPMYGRVETTPEVRTVLGTVNGELYYYWSTVESSWKTKSTGSQLFSSFTCTLIGYMNSSVTTSQDLTLNDVCPQEVPLPDHYPEWASKQATVTNPDGTDEIYWPIGIDGSIGENKDMSQEEAQSGEGTLELPEEDPDATTATDPAVDPDPTTGNDDPDTGTSTDPDTGTSGNPSENVNKFKLDLKEFFPFCIPWDIAAFLGLFQAEPEAPKFEWDIDFPYMDEPWHIVVDLSPWNDTAQLLRRLELVAFIVGLAVVTRERYLRG